MRPYPKPIQIINYHQLNLRQQASLCTDVEYCLEFAHMMKERLDMCSPWYNSCMSVQNLVKHRYPKEAVMNIMSHSETDIVEVQHQWNLLFWG